MLKYLIASGMTTVREGHRDFYSWSSTMLNDFGPSIEPLLRDLFNWSLFMAGNRHNPLRRGINCWEFKQCLHGRDSQKGMRRVCPAVVETRLNGVHGGTNAGRSCWVVDGTLCDGKKQRRFHKKQKMCLSCDFYQSVLEEEGIDIVLPVEFLRSCALDS